MSRLLSLLLLLGLAGQALGTPPRLLALSYHDVVQDRAAALRDPAAVTVDTLVNHFAWLDDHGYEPITLDQWHAGAAGAPLPDKPVLLTFDDGYASFYHQVLPLLTLFDYPAVLAPVTSWIDTPAGATVDYGSEQVERDHFMTWQQLREVAASGRVEIASHSHDLHHGIVANPFGNTRPAATSRRYDPATSTYESEQHYTARVRADLARSAELIERHVGERPRTIVWPYGAYNAQVTAIADSLGMNRSLTLAELPNSPLQRHVHRRLIGSDMSLQGFVMTARGLYPPPAVRAAHVDLDYVYDDDPAQQAANLDRLLDRIKAMRISRVFLQAFADPDGNGVADAVYFPNRHLPVRADLFDRVAWQLKTRAGVEVFAWMPVLAWELPDAETNRRLAVQSADGSHHDRYHRLSPFHAETRRIVAEIYEDLGRYTHSLGVLFHDDAFLTDAEDTSPAALQHYSQHLGIDVTVDGGELALSGASPAEFARAKTLALLDFTDELAGVLRQHQPALVTAANLYARLIMQPESEAWFAQNYRLFLDRYDYTAVMAMPYLEGAEAPRPWLKRLIERAKAHPRALERTVFELQTVDWRAAEPLPERELAAQIELLLDAGVRHIAWYPDDFIANHPSLELLRATVSLADHPAVLE